MIIFWLPFMHNRQCLLIAMTGSIRFLLVLAVIFAANLLFPFRALIPSARSILQGIQHWDIVGLNPGIGAHTQGYIIYALSRR